MVEDGNVNFDDLDESQQQQQLVHDFDTQRLKKELDEAIEQESSNLLTGISRRADWFAVLNSLLAIEVLFAVLNRLFVSVSASTASFALFFFSKIDLSFLGTISSL